MDDCEEAIRLDPNNIKAFIRKGDCLAKIGEYEASRQAYLQASRLDTNATWRDHINKAMLLLPSSMPQSHNCPHPHTHPPVHPHVHPQAHVPPVNVHHAYPPQQAPAHTQSRAYSNPARAQTQYAPQYPGYTYYQNNNNNGSSSSGHSQDRRRGHDAESCNIQ